MTITGPQVLRLCGEGGGSERTSCESVWKLTKEERDFWRTQSPINYSQRRWLPSGGFLQRPILRATNPPLRLHVHVWPTTFNSCVWLDSNVKRWKKRLCPTILDRRRKSNFRSGCELWIPWHFFPPLWKFYSRWRTLHLLWLFGGTLPSGVFLLLCSKKGGCWYL